MPVFLLSDQNWRAGILLSDYAIQYFVHIVRKLEPLCFPGFIREVEVIMVASVRTAIVSINSQYFPAMGYILISEVGNFSGCTKATYRMLSERKQNMKFVIEHLFKNYDNKKILQGGENSAGRPVVPESIGYVLSTPRYRSINI